MDPDKALEEIAELLGIHQDRPLLDEEVTDLVEKVCNLDEWLCSGGFLPTQWSKYPNSRNTLEELKP